MAFERMVSSRKNRKTKMSKMGENERAQDHVDATVTFGRVIKTVKQYKIASLFSLEIINYSKRDWNGDERGRKV